MLSEDPTWRWTYITALDKETLYSVRHNVCLVLGGRTLGSVFGLCTRLSNATHTYSSSPGFTPHLLYQQQSGRTQLPQIKSWLQMKRSSRPGQTWFVDAFFFTTWAIKILSYNPSLQVTPWLKMESMQKTELSLIFYVCVHLQCYLL